MEKEEYKVEENSDLENVTFTENADMLLHFCCLLQTLQEEFLELNNFLDISEQTFDVVARKERFFLQWLQISLNQTVEVLKTTTTAARESALRTITRLTIGWMTSLTLTYCRSVSISSMMTLRMR